MEVIRYLLLFYVLVFACSLAFNAIDPGLVQAHQAQDAILRPVADFVFPDGPNGLIMLVLIAIFALPMLYHVVIVAGYISFGKDNQEVLDDLAEQNTLGSAPRYNYFAQHYHSSTIWFFLGVALLVLARIMLN